MTHQNRRRLPRLQTLGLLLITLTALLASSCRSGRNAAGSNTGDYSQNTGKTLSQSQLKTMLNNLSDSYGTWSDVKIPLTLRLKSPKKISIGGTLTMQRDRSVHLSLRFLGMEVASLMVTQDSIFALYKLERLYFAESISDLLGGFPATVGNVQDLLLGRAFILGDTPLAPSRCTLAGTPQNWTITPSGSPSGMSYAFTLSTPTGNLESLTVTPATRKPLTAEYTDFATGPVGPFAATTLLTAAGGKTTLSAQLELNARRAEWNTGATKNWSTPKGYTRIKAADILKIVTKMAN
ncbi:DUF4292 domain-containing protein [Duncaniella muris]|uniref:DUF4292 domain-containing protein n=1 Tax=Duncaniella muris TaxID=2094150 RepID=UPI0025A99248|nr:DUF4292 domain-containing protein [Duncaniella muris]